MVADLARAAEARSSSHWSQLVEHIPLPAPPRRGRGRPRVYSDRLFLKALVIMIVRHLPTVHTLLAVLDQPTAEMQRLRALLDRAGPLPRPAHLGAAPARDARPPCRPRSAAWGATWSRCSTPGGDCGRAVAIDSTVLRGPRRRLAPEAPRARASCPIPPSTPRRTGPSPAGTAGSTAGSCIWSCTVAAVWIPLAAELTPANAADNEVAPRPAARAAARGPLPAGRPALRRPRRARSVCAQADRALVTTQHGAYPHTDDGVEVRRVFHQLRSHGHRELQRAVQGPSSTCHGQVPTRGLRATRRFALGAVFVYQLAAALPLEQWRRSPRGLKPFLAGRLRIYDQASISR